MRRNNFDALRLIGATMVLLSHMAPLSGRAEWLWMGEHSVGNFGVLIFFSISGYLVAASWRSDPELGRFLQRRFLRMFPGLAVSLAVTYLGVMALGLQGFPGNPADRLNGSLWTIPLEVYCYLILAGIAMVAPKPVPVFAVGMVLAYGFLPADYLSNFGLYFAAGALLQAFPAYRSGWLALVLVVGGAVLLAVTPDATLGLALALPPVVVWIGSQSWPVLRSAGRYGDLSYGIYIYAWPVQQVVVHYLPGASYYTLAAVSLVVTAGLAWLSWRHVEAPALARKPLRPSAGLQAN